MANDNIEEPRDPDDIEATAIFGVHPQPDWFEEEWEQSLGTSDGYTASKMERALHGARGVAAILAREQRNRASAEANYEAYKGLSALDRESLHLALEALHDSAIHAMESLRGRLTKRAKKDREWVEIPVVGPAQ